jgi:O-antigen/teichoic acid export membrane protein
VHVVGRLRRELGTPLHRNAYALMANTAVNSGLGLAYWVLAARVFPAAEVGRSSALVSLMVLVSTLTQLNFGGALVRFMPRAGHGARRLLLGAYAVAVAVACAGSAGVMLWCALVVPADAPLHVGAGFAAWFVVSTMVWSVFTLQDAALTGMRSASWIPLENGLYGLLKLGLLVVMAAVAVPDGVFTSWSAPVVVLLVGVNLLIFRRVLPRHAAATAPTQQVPGRRALARYMVGDYAAQTFNQLSSTFLPVLVVMLLGAEAGAWFLPAQTVFAAIGLLAAAITSSLVVEAATDEARAPQLAAAVLRRICLVVLPAAAVVALAAPWLLELYGPAYRAGATLVLQLMMVSLVPRVVVALAISRLRLERRTGALALLQLAQAVILVGGTVVFARTVGLAAVGWSAIAAELLPALVVGPSLARWLAGRGPQTGRNAPG